MLPDKAKFVVCSVISLALSFWVKQLVIGQLRKPAKFSAFYWSTSRKSGFHWSAFGNQHGSPFTETNRNSLIHHIRCLITLSGWLGGAMVLGKLPVPGPPSNLADSRARAYCACSGCGLGVVWSFLLSSIFSLLFLPLFGRRPDID